jgi:DNA-binding transcriptional regulator YiaG
MPNITSLLKEEISRVARKEIRVETGRLKKSSTQYRSDIAALKRRLADLERQLKNYSKGNRQPPAAADEKRKGFRFSAKGFAAQRQRLGLSAREVGALLEVSQLSIYKWEKGQSKPRAKQMEAIAQLRGMGKREAAARLNELG